MLGANGLRELLSLHTFANPLAGAGRLYGDAPTVRLTERYGRVIDAAVFAEVKRLGSVWQA
jgi:hypothetical protein